MADERLILDFDGQRLPYSREAEQSILGAIIVDPVRSFSEIKRNVKEEYFFIPQHREIFTTLSHMFEINHSIDFITLIEKLRDNGVYDEAGGKRYITELAEMVPSVANIGTYVEIIKDRFLTRSLILAAQNIITDANESTLEPDKLIESAEQRIYDIRQGRNSTGLVHIAKVITDETYDRLTKINDPETREDYIGIPTGIGELDKVITGLHKSDLIIVGARPGMGKTSFALNIARNAAFKSKKKVCFFSLEMTRDQLAQRLLSNEASIESTKLRTGELTPEEWVRLANAGKELSKTQI